MAGIRSPFGKIQEVRVPFTMSQPASIRQNHRSAALGSKQLCGRGRQAGGMTNLACLDDRRAILR